MASGSVNVITPQQRAARTVAALVITSDPGLIRSLESMNGHPGSNVFSVDLDTQEFPAPTPKESQISPRAARREKEKEKKRMKQRARTRIQARPCPNGRQRQFQRNVRSLR